MDKIEFIKKVETEGLVFSVLENQLLLQSFQVDKLDKNPNLKLVYSESDFFQNKIDYKCKLFLSSNGFYVYVKKHLTIEGISKYELTIYHLPDQINEIIIFLKFINK
jgi:hypothetical protein